MMNIVSIRSCSTGDAETISAIAQKSWWPTYGPFLSNEQISFMLDDLYAPDRLRIDIEQGIGFLMAEVNQTAVGFVSFTPKTNSPFIYRIEKLYLVEQAQGLGLGKALVDNVSTIAKQQGFNQLELNVNRYNPAFAFYKKQGFSVVKEVDIPYHQFVLNDYVMQKDI